ncbi:3-hydroxyisobutyrate dehydrogenase family protein [Pseudomonas sp. R4-39-08]|uniref:NAD(P)-dependent oxidoreductase n=1 Tax=Pseudomonas sp. R4-39-08 TaxID=1173288 RepID=UPI000F5628B2|nr:NAD(P)-dependent oxidoreductase [Pseudomonas sp. R4-39-08]AZF38392.1 3-hydroxyisobutyrate dehydrogenase family protein [Pseudomonas sp. R4-39-08]
MTNFSQASAQSKTVAVLGTGIIGAAVARNLQKNAFNVNAWNRTYEKATALSVSGVEVFEKAEDAVRGASIILTVLKDGPAVLEAMKAALPGLVKGTVWLQLSTVGVKANEELTAFAEQHGLEFYDAPVQGTRGPAEQGQLIIIASGSLSQREAIQPIFDAIGKRTLWVSEQSGVSSKLKLALNSWAFALTHGIAESLSIAEALGVDPALVVDVVKGGPMDSMYFQLKAASILSGDYTVSFSVANAVKDAELVVEAAKEAGVKVDAVAAGLNRFNRALQAGHGDKDMAASYLAK